MNRIPSSRPLAGTLLLTVSAFALVTPAQARQALFVSDPAVGRAALAGERVTQQGGLTQIRLDNGGTASFVEGAGFRLREDGSIDLYSGSVTVSGGAHGPVVVHLADRGEARVEGVGSAASFSVDADGARGHVMTGSAAVAFGGAWRTFTQGQMWHSDGNRAQLAVAIGEQAVPEAGEGGGEEPRVFAQREGGPLAAANNGVPVVLGDALAAAGASGDILAAARRVEAAVAAPALESFPSGDLALLVAYAGRLEGAYGGQPFNGAAADVIRTYLQFLAGGGSRAEFLTVYAGLMTQYLDLLRSNALPSSFAGASQAQINSFIAYRGRTSGFAALSGQNRTLVEAYLAFIQQGGSANQFVPRYTDLTNAYFAFLRGGGLPADFAGASQQTVNAYLAFLRDAGLLGRLSAQNQALLSAYLDSLAQGGNGLAFAEQYQAALGAWFAYLQGGGLPSAYAGGDPAVLRGYLETLQATGLFDTVLGSRAQFYSGYLAWLQGGGSLDGYGQLPVNIFTGYAGALDAYYTYLARGGLPSAYTGGDPALLRTYLEALAAAGASGRFLGANATFYADYLTWLQGGGAIDGYAGLAFNVFTGYAGALQAYYDYLARGGVPSAYAALTQAQISAYLAALDEAGARGLFLGDLSDFWGAFFAYLAGGGNPDLYAGLPVPPDYPAFADALNAYAAYLAGGGLPSTYSATDLEHLRVYLEAIVNAGRLNELLGSNGALLSAYFTYIAGGGTPDGFSGLPVYATYVNALEAYYAWLAGGGLPSAYSGLNPAQLQAYLQALVDAGVFNSLFTGDTLAFLTSYYNHVSGGGTPDGYTGLPVHATYVAALEAYYAWLQGGGLPSGYTALTVAQIQAYIQALIDAGVYNALFNAQLAAFFNGYYQFVLGGGSADSYSGLPVNSGGGGGGSGTLLTTYTGGFTPSAGTRAMAARAGYFYPGTGTPIVSSDGVLTSAGSNIQQDQASATDVAGNADALIGRYVDGRVSVGGSQYNLSGHMSIPYIALAPITGSLPTTGTIDYRLLAATHPVFSDGSTAPGTFQGALTLGFASDVYGLTYRTQGSITMPESGGNVTYDYATDNYASGAMHAMSYNSSSQMYTYTATMTNNGQACFGAGCAIYFTGGFAGANPQDTFGVIYQTYPGSSSGVRILGSALFTPVTGGGGLSGYTGGFDGTSPRINFITTLRLSSGSMVAGSEAGFEALSYSLDANGGLQSYSRAGGYTRTNGTTTVTDIYGNADVLIGRWTDGTNTGANPFTLDANQGLHYMLARPVPTGFALPTTGSVHYSLLAATSPTIVDGSLAPGQFAGEMALLFGSTPRLAMEATITMPRSGGDLVLSYATQGGMADPWQSTSGFNFYPNSTFNFSVPGSSAGGSSCTAGTCSFNAYGAFGGSTDNLGITYTATHPGGSAQSVIGAAIFGADGDVPAPPAQTRTNQSVAYATRLIGTDRHTGASVTYDGASGAPTAFTVDADVQLAQGTTTLADAGRAGSVLSWARWTGGTPTGTYYGDHPGTIGTNGGYHVIAGEAVSNMPTSGTVSYQLIGQTRPTFQDERSAPGTLTGSAAVAFGSTSRVGFDLDVAIDSQTYNVQTSGGVATPGSSGITIAPDGTFDSPFNSLTVTSTSSFCAPSCSAFIDGFLAGNGASHMGLSYEIRNNSTPQTFIDGTAAFQAGP